MRDFRIIRYPIDIISVLLVLCALSIQLSALIYKWPWYTLIPILFLVRGVDLVEHNHAHLTVFRSGGLNSLLGWMCHLSNGVPLDVYRIHHVANHHRYNNRFTTSGRDWSSIFGFRRAHFPNMPIGKSYYVASFPFIAICECSLWFLRAPKSRATRGFIVSMFVTGVTCGLLVWLNLLGFLIFFLIPWLVVAFGMGSNNYDQHEGCNVTDSYDSANNYLSFFYTVLSFNVGYHLEHHLKPNLHWSLLPHFHRAIKGISSAGDYLRPRQTIRSKAASSGGRLWNNSSF